VLRDGKRDKFQIVLAMRGLRGCMRGFTLIELMVTLAIGSILMLIAVPSFETYRRNAELTSFTNTLVASINAARGEAMKRGMNAMVVPNDGANWASGWVVFVDVDRDGAFTAATDLQISVAGAPPPYIVVNNLGANAAANLYIMYDPSGYSRLLTTGAFGAWTFQIARNDVPAAELLPQTRRIKIASTGRLRVCTPRTTIDTNCTATIAN
jgi:type IV fimbrial biogenesis protein FimT